MSSDDIQTPIDNLRATKRKLDDAFQHLDDTVQPALKKSNTSRSVYSTLAKYGIKSKGSANEVPQETYKNAPKLSAILTRAATRTKKSFPFKFSEPRPPSTIISKEEYRPSSISSFLSRLSTFKLSTYSNKPPAIDAVAASKCGWVNDGKDRLVCGVCTSSWVVASKEGMSRDAANALIEKQKVQLVDAHKPGCPWRMKQCDASIYRIPLQSPSILLRDIKANATSLDALLDDVEIKHPLTSNQLIALRSTIKLYTLSLSVTVSSTQTDPPSSSSPSATSEEPSEKTILVSLFGWSIAPAAERPALTRASSLAPQTPPRSRESSVVPRQSPNRLSVGPSTTLAPPKRDSDTLLQCSLCQRRIGLWTFGLRPESSTSSRAPTKRPFDLLKEHRSYCPYVVRSTVIPTLSPQAHLMSQTSLTGGAEGALEGWRAVVTVVLRYGMAQRSHLTSGRRPSETHEGGESEREVVDGGIEAMVEGVKARGGKDLLKYVRGLLG
ncbi:zf-C3HC-domain-containing protein [Desarmillaria tabescens]|uniref:Zf-C3HC-domain-containing protein n=1 Tax=Armillaria tabescens TaxID=1929756 RepID=A0AA39NR06_ARMTA|nr:zf-C3HC-domain-containing protein [Desarmillaria tabescens]KAK0469928.1 zf-C3HC-domain-containing protein [Desarmillaria tabescens]